MIKVLSNLKLAEKIIITLIFLAIFLFVVPPFQFSYFSDVLVVSTVLFTILCGFFLAATLTNYLRLQSLISEETGNLISLRDTYKALSPSYERDINNAIDNYIIAEFDFELTDCVDNTWKEFNQILQVTDNVKSEKKESNLFSYMMQIRTDLLKIRQEFSLVARRIIGPLNWVILTSLAFINTILLRMIIEPAPISHIVFFVLSSMFFLVLFLLDEIDSNTFAEEKISFESYQRVFKEIGKLPYYPEVSIKKGRIKPKGVYRIGIYKNFSKSFDKEIKTVKH